MNIFDTAAALILMAAAFSYLNHTVFKLPSTIGLLISGLMASGAIIVTDSFFPSWGLGSSVQNALQSINFPQFLMHGLLSFLLFAGSLHIDLEALLTKKWSILTLASVGVLIATAIFGFGSYALFKWLGFPVPLSFCLVFGALISPTDPVAVLGIMKSLKVPKSLEIKVAGESLLNDGVSIVLFTVLLSIAMGGLHGGEMNFGSVVIVFLHEAVGGIVLGLISGTIVYFAMKRINEPNLEVLLSFALVMGMTFVAFQIHTSAPLACVVAGLFIGNHGRSFAMQKRTRDALDYVWSFTDYSLNALLFLVLGLEVIAFSFSKGLFISILLMIPLFLVGRWLSVLIPISVLKFKREFSKGAVTILTWGGLRGGISVALALSLPAFPGRNAVLTVTYGIVIFSILVQGMTIGPLIRRINKGSGLQ